MAALTDKRMTKETRLKNVALPLAGSQKVFQGGIACADTTAAAVKKGASGNSNLLRLGEFLENVDNSGTSAKSQVLVSLDQEVVVRWYDNDTGANAVSATSIFTDVYILDDHTVTTSSSTNSKAGRVWLYDSSANQVAVEATTGVVGLL